MPPSARFVIHNGRADIALAPTRVVWHLDPAKADEIASDLAGLNRIGRAGHHYVDISSPAETVVLSRDEYVDRVYPWIDPPACDETTER